jgi:hypothetical protein
MSTEHFLADEAERDRGVRSPNKGPAAIYSASLLDRFKEYREFTDLVVAGMRLADIAAALSKKPESLLFGRSAIAILRRFYRTQRVVNGEIPVRLPKVPADAREEIKRKVCELAGDKVRFVE